MRAEEEVVADERVGGSIFAGFSKTFSSGYLFNTALFLLLFALTSTFLYFEQAGAASKAFPDRAARTEFFATVDLLVNVLTLIVQLFLTGRILRVLGITLTLALLPAVSVIGFGAAVAAPDGGRDRRLPGDPPRRQFRHRPAHPRDPLHRRPARGPLQGEGLHRHRRVPVRRPARGLVHGPSSTATTSAARQVALIAVPLSVLWLLDSLWLGRQQKRLAAQATVPAPDRPSNQQRLRR